MKKGLLGSTALMGAGVLAGAAAWAAEAPEWTLSGNVNFQFYYVDQDAGGIDLFSVYSAGAGFSTTWTQINLFFDVFDVTAGGQDHGWYFGVDEAELALNVSGTADNGLNYGFKIEIQVNTTDPADDGGVADEARIQLSGGWGTLHLGDEDGAEDIMNYGGENLMGATGGFDGDRDDYLYRGGDLEEWAMSIVISHGSTTSTTVALNFRITTVGNELNIAAPGYPTIAGDTGDATKISYYTPRIGGFQVGASITPTPNGGDNFKADGAWENHYGVGVNYDSSFGSLRVRASAVYSARSNVAAINSGPLNGQDAFTDVSAWSVGGIVGWGAFSIGGNYTDNGDSGQTIVGDLIDGGPPVAASVVETSYWNVAAGFEAGPLYIAAGYFLGTAEFGVFEDSTYEHIALTADYTAAPGLGFHAEVNLITDELIGGSLNVFGGTGTLTNDTTSLILGVNVSF